MQTPKHQKKDPSLDFCEFFTGCPEVMGACDFNGLRYLQTIDATTGWVEFRVGSFRLTHRGFLCWGVLTSWFGGVFWPEWFFRCLKWKIHLWNFGFRIFMPQFLFKLGIRIPEIHGQTKNLRLCCWKLASKRNFRGGGGPFGNFFRIFWAREKWRTLELYGGPNLFRKLAFWESWDLEAEDLAEEEFLFTPWKPTWNLKMDPWKKRFLLGFPIIFRFRVSFLGV